VQLAERSYDIDIGTGNLATAGDFVASRAPLTHALVISDENVDKSYGGCVADALQQSGARVDRLVVKAGEPSKSVAQADRLWRRMLELSTDRKTIVIAVGGGVIGDLAGFVAATFARGLDFFQVPTTLLAQVDSSVGGKVAVNLPAAKNMVGAFWQPRGVLIDTRVLETLPEREYRAGLGEVVKYGVILDADFFAYLETHVDAIQRRQADVLCHIIARCCRLKADVVEADEREETGVRSKLNYGHTFCHAIESLTGYGRYLHGEAVAIGMLCASRLAEKLDLVDSQVTHRQHALLRAVGLPVELPDLDPQQFLSAMQRDKKVAHGQLRFVLPTKIGHVDLVANVPNEQVLSVLSN
jgi:3-dehydroquinate synthase